MARKPRKTKVDPNHQRISLVVDVRDPVYEQFLKIRKEHRDNGVSEADLYAWALIESSGKPFSIPEGARGFVKEVAKIRAEMKADRDKDAERYNKLMEAITAIRSVDLSQYTDKKGKSLKTKLGEMIPNDVRDLLTGMAEGQTFSREPEYEDADE